MKKIIAILLTVTMLGAVVCAAAENLAGGWSVADDNRITENNKALFDKAVEGLLGVNYEPVAYLGSQVVAGVNHCFLCRATVVYPGAVPTLALVYIYEDLQGGLSILQILDLPLGITAEDAEE